MTHACSRWFLAVSAAVTLAGCASTPRDIEVAPSVRPLSMRVIQGQVNALGVDPADGSLYVATGAGLVQVRDGRAQVVADLARDTTGFVVVGEGHFLAGGHPAPQESLPLSLGLVESADAGQTWEPVSLLGQADLHALDVSGHTVYAYEATGQSLIVSDDGQRWTAVSQLLALHDIAADPADADAVYAVTGEGALLRSRNREELSPVYGAPEGLAEIDWQPGGPLVAATSDGDVLVSPDAGSGWNQVGTLGGPVEALDVLPGSWHAATRKGIFESTDDGASWTLVIRRKS